MGFNDGTPITIVPFRFTFYTNAKRATYVAEYDGTEFINCFPTDDGRVRIPFDGHKLGTGILKAKIQFFVSDSDFEDGKYDWVSDESMNIVLDKGATDTFEDFEWVISRPNTRGLEMLLERPYINTGAGGDIPNGSVTTAKIKDGAVTEDKLSDEVKKKLNQAGSSFNGSASEVTFDGDSVGLISKDVQSAIEEVNAKIDMYKEATIDFGTGEDTVTMAIMESGTTVTKVKTRNVKTLYLSYGNVTKAEYTGGEVSLGNADFLVMTIIRTSSDVDAVVGLTLR